MRLRINKDINRAHACTRGVSKVILSASEVQKNIFRKMTVKRNTKD